MSAAAEDARGYDRWLEQPWGRYAFTVVRIALLNVPGPLDERDVRTSAAAPAGSATLGHLQRNPSGSPAG